MPRRTNDFQTLVTAIETCLAEVGSKVTESAMLQDRVTGELREVDTLVEGQIDGRQIVVGLECRDHRRPQNVTWIEQVIGKYRDLPVDMVIAVSKSGFYEPALKKAAHYNILTLTPDDANKLDWNSILSNLEMLTVTVGGAPSLQHVLLAQNSLVNAYVQVPVIPVQPEMLSRPIRGLESDTNLGEYLNRICKENDYQAYAQEMCMSYAVGKDNYNIECAFEHIENRENPLVIEVNGSSFQFSIVHFGLLCGYKKFNFPLSHLTYKNTVAGTSKLESNRLNLVEGSDSDVLAQGILELIFRNFDFDNLPPSFESFDFERLANEDAYDVAFLDIPISIHGKFPASEEQSFDKSATLRIRKSLDSPYTNEVMKTAEFGYILKL